MASDSGITITPLKAAAIGAVAVAAVGAFAYLSRSSKLDDESLHESTTKIKSRKPGEAVDPNHARALELKNAGNTAFQSQNHLEAIRLYTEALALSDVDAHLIYSNRAYAHMHLKNYDLAVADARECVRLKPDWSKGYFRLGKSSLLRGDHEEAYINFYKGMKLAPKDEDMLRGLKEAGEKLQFSIGDLDTRTFLETKHVSEYFLRMTAATCARIGADRERLAEQVKESVAAKESDNELLAREYVAGFYAEHPVEVLEVLCQLLMDVEGGVDTAYALCLRAKLVAPKNENVLLLLTHIMIRRSSARPDEVMETARQAMVSHPDNVLIVHTYASLLMRVTNETPLPVPVSTLLRELLVAFNSHSANQLLVADVGMRLWFTLFDYSIQTKLANEEMVGTQQGLTTNQIVIRSLLQGAFKELVRNEFFMAVCRRVRLVNLVLERVLSPFRPALCTLPAGTEFDELLPLTLVIAEQCYRNNYLWDPKSSLDEETTLLKIEKQLKNRIGQDDAVVDGLPERTVYHHLVVLAMYRSLATVDGIEAFLQRLDMSKLDPQFAALLRMMVLAPREEARVEQEELELLCGDLPSGPLVDYYDSHVAATWDYGQNNSLRRTYGEELRWLFRKQEFSGFDGSRPDRVLVAGCGSGQEVFQQFLTYTNIDVTAIDISKVNLAYAMRQNRDLGMAAAKFYLCDVLQLSPDDFEQQLFDVVQSYGLLSLLADPLEGLRRLVDVVRPGGILKLGVYSTRFIKIVSTIRTYLAPHFTPPIFDQRRPPLMPRLLRQPTVDELRTARRMIVDNEPEVLQELNGLAPFFSLNEFQDMVFHPQMTGFTFAAVDALVKNSGLELLTFEFPGVSQESILQYRAEHPDDYSLKNGKYLDAFDDATGALNTVGISPQIMVYCRKPVGGLPSPAANSAASAPVPPKSTSGGWLSSLFGKS